MLYDNNVLRLEAFLTLDNIEFNTLPFVEGFETIRHDSIEVHKNVTTSITLDKAVAFARVEPFYNTLFFRHDLELLSKNIASFILGSKSKVKLFFRTFFHKRLSLAYV